jgi:magnesium chelatase subunit I
VEFTLVGTMNPDEGGLRPQLLDRFGLVATVESESEAGQRRRIVETVLRFEAERGDPDSEFMTEALRTDAERRVALDLARRRLDDVTCDGAVYAGCAAIAEGFRLAGHRGEIVLLRAARALAAIQGDTCVTTEHLRRVAKPTLVHRRGRGDTGTLPGSPKEPSPPLNRSGLGAPRSHCRTGRSERLGSGTHRAGTAGRDLGNTKSGPPS